MNPINHQIPFVLPAPRPRNFPVNHTGGSVAGRPIGPEDSLPDNVAAYDARITREGWIRQALEERYPPPDMATILATGNFLDPNAIYAEEVRIRNETPFPPVNVDVTRAKIQAAVAAWVASETPGLVDNLGTLEGQNTVQGSPFERDNYLSYLQDLPKIAGKIAALWEFNPGQAIERVGYLANKIFVDLKRGRALVYAPVDRTSNGFFHLPLAPEERNLARYLGPKGTQTWKARLGQLVIALFFEGRMIELDVAADALKIVKVPDNKDLVTRRILPTILQGWVTTEADRHHPLAIRLWNEVIHLLETQFDAIEHDERKRIALMTLVYANMEMANVYEESHFAHLQQEAPALPVEFLAAYTGETPEEAGVVEAIARVTSLIHKTTRVIAESNTHIQTGLKGLNVMNEEGFSTLLYEADDAVCAAMETATEAETKMTSVAALRDAVEASQRAMDAHITLSGAFMARHNALEGQMVNHLVTEQAMQSSVKTHTAGQLMGQVLTAFSGFDAAAAATAATAAAAPATA